MKWQHHLPRVGIVNREELILERCKGRRILHLGCVGRHSLDDMISRGSSLHSRLEEVARELWGIDVDNAGLNRLRAMGTRNLIWGDVERLDSVRALKSHTFDVLVAGELIEHLSNPGNFLRSCTCLLSRNTVMILTTPNAFRFLNLLFMLVGTEAIHPNHNFWFSPTSLRTLLNRHGYEVLDTFVYRLQNYVTLRKGETFKNIARILLLMINAIVQTLVVRVYPFLGDGLVYIVRKSHD